MSNEVNKIANYNQMMSWLTRPATPKTQVADLVDDLEPGSLKDELKKDFDPSQETYEEYLQRKNLDRPFNAQDGGRANLAIGSEPETTQAITGLVDNMEQPIEDTTMGPGGYPMTAGLQTIIQVPKALKAIESGAATFNEAKKIVTDFYNKRQAYTGATKIGESTTKDFTPEKNFLSVLKSFMNKYTGGSLSQASRDLGISRNTLKGINERINFQETGKRVSSGLGQPNINVPTIATPENGLYYPALTTKMKNEPLTFKALKKEKDEFVDAESVGHYLGMVFERTSKGSKTQLGKTQYDAFQKKLKDLGVKSKDRPGTTGSKIFSINDTITKLLKNPKKLVKGQRVKDAGKDRYTLEKKFDPELFSIRAGLIDRVGSRAKGLDVFQPNAVDDIGHPFSLSKSIKKYDKLFKDSNINSINTLVYQDHTLNTTLHKVTGFEGRYEKMFDELVKLQNKKITPKIQEQLINIKNKMNVNYNNYIKTLSNPKEIKEILNKNELNFADDFVKYLSNQTDRVHKIDINVPKVGDTFKSKDVFVDMSKINPKYIMGYVNQINPRAKKFKDLSMSEQAIFKQNALDQNADIVSEYYKKAKYPIDDVEAVKETIKMDFAKGGRVGLAEGTTEKIIKGAKKASNIPLKTLAGVDTPLMQLLFATGYEAGDDPFFYTLPAAFTDMTNRYLNLYEKSPGKAKTFLKSTLRLLPIEKAKQFYPIFSKLGKVGSTTGYPFLKAASEGLKELKVRAATRDAASDFKMSPEKMMELRNKSLRKENLPRLEDDTYVPTEQDYSDANNKIKEAKDRFELSMKIMGSDLGLNENPLAEKESIYTRGKENPMSLDRVLYPNRQNFADGPEDPSKKGLGSLTKRNFLKILSLIPAGILAVRGGPNLLKKTEKATEIIKRGADGVPDFLADLIAKVKLKAEATGYKYFTGKSSDEMADVYQADNFVVTEQGNKTIIREVDDPSNPGYRENQIEIEVDPETGGVTYNEASARPDDQGKLKDVDEYIEDVDLENMRKYTYDE